MSSGSTIAPLLSSVSLLLAAFGFVYSTQKDRIDGVIADDDIPANADDKSAKRSKALSARNSAIWLGVAALVMWVLLVDEIQHKARAAVDHADLNKYSTPDVVFFVAANVWLLIVIFIARQVIRLQKRASALK